MHMQSLLKQIKIMKAVPTCFGLQENHHQGASQRLAKITHLVHVDNADTGHSTHRPHRSHYAAITLTTPVRPSMYPHEPSV